MDSRTAASLSYLKVLTQSCCLLTVRLTDELDHGVLSNTTGIEIRVLVASYPCSVYLVLL